MKNTKTAAGSVVTCPLCMSDEHQTLATRGRAGEDLHTVICTGCGLVFTSPIPTPQEVAEYYAKDYRLKYKGVSQPKLKHIYRSGCRALDRFTHLQQYASPGQTILDVGSGGGEFLYLLSQRGFQPQGIEPDEGYGGYSIQEYGINVQIGPFADCRLATDSIDIATAHHVVEHLCDPLDVFRGVHAALKADGLFIVEVPNVESTYHTPSNKWHFAHIFNFNPNTLENLGRRAGFDVVASDLASRSRHVRCVFRKSERSPLCDVSHENYRRVRQALDDYTNWDHYTSLMPAKRVLSSLSQTMKERIAVDQEASGREILDRLYSRAANQNADVKAA